MVCCLWLRCKIYIDFSVELKLFDLHANVSAYYYDRPIQTQNSRALSWHVSLYHWQKLTYHKNSIKLGCPSLSQIWYPRPNLWHIPLTFAKAGCALGYSYHWYGYRIPRHDTEVLGWGTTYQLIWAGMCTRPSEPRPKTHISETESFKSLSETRHCSFRDAGRDLEATETRKSLGIDNEKKLYGLINSHHGKRFLFVIFMTKKTDMTILLYDK